MGHARLASGGQAPDQASSLRSGPMPAAASGQVRRMTPPGSVIPRVTPTATDDGPDHHRTEGSLTVIPQDPTAANQTALNGIPTQPELPRPYWSLTKVKMARRSERLTSPLTLGGDLRKRSSAQR
jgi:hypothetical protein